MRYCHLKITGSAPTNRITSVTSGGTLSYTYDANGNVTNDGAHSYTYDSENRLVNVDNGAAVYAYDHQNRRYKKTIGSSVTHNVWEGSQVVGEYNGNTGAVLVQYGYAGSRMIAKTAGGVTQYFLSDRLSVRLALSDVGVVSGRQATLPFGEDFAESGTQEKHHFTSYERDGESGFDYGVNRYYGSLIGRFVTVDPIYDVGFKVQRSVSRAKAETNSPSSPQDWNRFNYTQDDPLNRIDPLGLFNWKCVWEATKCFIVIDGYIVAMGGLAVVCPETVGVACIAALLLHPAIAYIVVEQCAACLKACGFENKMGIIPKPGRGSGGGGGGGGADVGIIGGGGGGGDPYGFGGTSSFLKWLYSTNPEGNPEDDHLA